MDNEYGKYDDWWWGLPVWNEASKVSKFQNLENNLHVSNSKVFKLHNSKFQKSRISSSKFTTTLERTSPKFSRLEIVRFPKISFNHCLFNHGSEELQLLPTSHLSNGEYGITAGSPPGAPWIWDKKCTFSADRDHVGPCLGFPAPLKSGGFAFRPSREHQGLVLDRFPLIFDLKKYWFQGLYFLFKNSLFVV